MAFGFESYDLNIDNNACTHRRERRRETERARKRRGRHAEESRKSREKVLDTLWAGKHMLNLIARIGGSP